MMAMVLEFKIAHAESALPWKGYRAWPRFEEIVHGIVSNEIE